MSNKESNNNDKDTLVAMDNNAVAIELDKSDKHGEMLSKYFAELRKAPVDAKAIYGESLQNFVIQLEFLSNLSGALTFVSKSLGVDMPPGDAKLLANIDESVNIVMDTICEKFGPRPR